MAANMNVINNEVFEALASLEKEKGIPREYMYEKIRQAMLTAFRKDTPDCEDNVILAAAKIPSVKLTQQRTVFM